MRLPDTPETCCAPVRRLNLLLRTPVPRITFTALPVASAGPLTPTPIARVRRFDVHAKPLHPNLFPRDHPHHVRRLRRGRVPPRPRRVLTLLLLILAGCGGTESPTETTTETTDTHVATTVTFSATTLSFSSFEDTQQLTATVRDQNGATMSGAPVTWVSSSSNVASVSSTGLVTAVADGTATVTATLGSATGTVSVTVQQVAAEVTLSPND